jgi:hypothetical protein
VGWISPEDCLDSASEGPVCFAYRASLLSAVLESQPCWSTKAVPQLFCIATKLHRSASWDISRAHEPKLGCQSRKSSQIVPIWRH